MTDDDPWIRAERKHEREMAELASRDNQRKRAYRQERAGWIISGVIAVLIVGTIAFCIWRVTATTTENNTRRDVACNESGGTRAQIGTGPTLCLHIGEVGVDDGAEVMP